MEEISKNEEPKLPPPPSPVEPTAETEKKTVKKKSTKKKAAKKKVAKKKVAKKAAVAKTSKKGRFVTGFDPFDDEQDIQEELRASLTRLNTIAKSRAVSFKTPSELSKIWIPLKNFTMQWLLSMRGIPSGCVIEVIAAEGIGKTTLMVDILSDAMDLNGISSLIIECENKGMDEGRMVEIAHENKDRARKIIDKMSFASARTHLQNQTTMETWVKAIREDSHYPADLPLIVVSDPFGKLMSEDEAAGRSDYGMTPAKLAAAKKKKKDVATGSNQGHAKYCHGWARTLPNWLEKNNVILFIVNHQNEKFSMDGGYQAPGANHDKYNDVTIGGSGIKQLAALRLISWKNGLYKDSSGNKLGSSLGLRVHKNSYGPNNREIKYRLKDDMLKHTETTHDDVLDFSEGLATWMASMSLLDTTESKKRYTCKAIDAVGVTDREFERLFYEHPDVVESLGVMLGIEGYEDLTGG